MKTFPYDVCWYCKAGGLIRTGTHCKEEESVYLRLLGCAKYMLGLNSLAFKAFEKECMNNHSPSYLFTFINGLFPLYVLGISIGIIFIFQSKLEYSRTFKMQKKQQQFPRLVTLSVQPHDCTEINYCWNPGVTEDKTHEPTDLSPLPPTALSLAFSMGGLGGWLSASLPLLPPCFLWEAVTGLRRGEVIFLPRPVQVITPRDTSRGTGGC